MTDRRSNDDSGQEVADSTAGASEARDLGRTFTDRDLYRLLQVHLAPVFWGKWEHLAPEMRKAISDLANAIWERLT